MHHFHLITTVFFFFYYIFFFTLPYRVWSLFCVFCFEYVLIVLNFMRELCEAQGIFDMMDLKNKILKSMVGMAFPFIVGHNSQKVLRSFKPTVLE